MNQSPPRLVTRVSDTARLSSRDWDDIWLLTKEFYDVEREYSEAELRRRQRIATFRAAGTLVGMAALDVFSAEFRGRKLAYIATPHVLIREPWRGRNLVQKLGLRTFIAARLRHPLRPIYWFFDTLSYKSYLVMTRNFRTCWPRHDEPTPEFETALIDELATRTYGPAWRPARGVAVRSGQKRLRESVGRLILTPDAAPDLVFFTHANPGHAEGDMLICLCPLTASNWISLARKALKRRRRRPAS